MKPIGLILIVIAVILGIIGVVFHWKEKPNYGEYFFFAFILLIFGVNLS